MFDFFNKTPKKEEPPSPSHSAAAAATAQRRSAQAAYSRPPPLAHSKEMVDLQAILEDGAQLEAAVRQGLEGQLLETSVSSARSTLAFGAERADCGQRG